MTCHAVSRRQTPYLSGFISRFLSSLDLAELVGNETWGACSCLILIRDLLHWYTPLPMGNYLTVA
jgi:hypothetical protein